MVWELMKDVLGSVKGKIIRNICRRVNIVMDYGI